MISHNVLLDTLNPDVMGFLNEIQFSFPKAISLASGRPDDRFFDLRDIDKYFNIYTNHLSNVENIDTQHIFKKLGQYDKTKGIINDLVARYLKIDYDIDVDPNDILVNVGTQESLIISILALCNKNEDVIMVEDPTYIGITHFSLIAGYETIPINVNSEGMCLKTLEKNILRCKEKGKNVKLVYVTPDFHNPTGVRMPVKNRIKLLELAEHYNFLIIEDNAYGDFVLEGNKYPTIKSLDKKNNVIYLHSFSKTIYPSLRIGVMVANKIMANDKSLSDLMSKVKGYTTVNTPSVTQAIVGGLLIDSSFSLYEYNEKKRNKLLVKRNNILEALTKYFTTDFFNNSSNKVAWNIPKGGYFLTLTLPVNITQKDVLLCAKEYDLIFTPMSFFYLQEGGENQIRIAYSNVQEDIIEKAMKSLSSFIERKICENLIHSIENRSINI